VTKGRFSALYEPRKIGVGRRRPAAGSAAPAQTTPVHDGRPPRREAPARWQGLRPQTKRDHPLRLRGKGRSVVRAGVRAALLGYFGGPCPSHAPVSGGVGL